MIRIGNTCRLKVLAKIDAGYKLGDGKDEVLLPKKLASKDLEVGQSLNVFVYTDSEDRPVATTQKPLAEVGDFVCLKCIDENQHGAFLDWGLDKDLFVPKGEQYQAMRVGDTYVVAVFLDTHTNRVAAASRLADFFDYDVRDVEKDEEVELLVHGFNHRGINVIVNDRFSGLIFRDRAFAKLQMGDRLKGYVDHVREDNKLDIRLEKAGHKKGKAKVQDATEVVLDALKNAGGTLPFGDKSSPEEIYDALGISKKAFKAAVGTLYKANQVEPGPRETKLIDD